MRISVNGIDLPKSAEGNLTIRQVLSELQSEIHERGKLLMRALVDGRPLANNWQEDPRTNSPIAGIGHLELVVDAPERVAGQMLNDSEQILDRLIREAEGIARRFRTGDDIVGNNELAAFLDDLKLVMSGVDLSLRHWGRTTPKEEARQRLEESAGNLIPILDRIYQAQANGDGIAVADEMQYELPPIIVEWQRLIGETARALEEPSTCT